MTMFLSWLDSFLRRFSRLGSDDIPDGVYTQLYMQFSMTCLLVPEIGQSFKSKMRIRGVKVSGNPDVRFYRFSMKESSDMMCMNIVTQAETKNLDYDKETCFNVHEHLPSNILGQHGIHLLMESKQSFFRPKVSGMILIGSKVIFTFLDIDVDHLKKIKDEDSEINGHEEFKSQIHYSRPFDFMDAVDRSEMLEAFFWLGYLQSSEYEFQKS